MIGLVADVSNRAVTATGKRMIDVVKETLLHIIDGLEAEDYFYLYGSCFDEPTDVRGRQIAAVASYQMDDVHFNLDSAFQQTYQVLLDQHHDIRPVLVYLTDRFSKQQSSVVLRMFQTVNDSSIVWQPIKLRVVGVDDHYDRELLEQMCFDASISFTHTRLDLESQGVL